MKRVVFRADASTWIGTGHIMRCLTLAQALQERGAKPSFVCREHQGNLIELLHKRGLVVIPLPAPPAPATPSIGTVPADSDYAAWLGVPQTADAESTIDVLNHEKPDWLIVDHYALGVEWEQRMRPHAERLFAIDDLSNRRHDCDLLLDQNYSVEADHRYTSLVPNGCWILSGPHYALLASEYAARREVVPVRGGRVRRVLAYFGGTDLYNMTGLALDVLSSPEFDALEVDVVIGPNNTGRAALDAQAAARPRTRVHDPRADLADLMAHADLAIGAGGVTIWERMCLGLPSLVVSLADNQRPTCEALANAGLIEYVGHVDAVRAPELRVALQRLLDQPDRLAALSRRGQELVDGRGTSRVADIMLGATGATGDARDAHLTLTRTRHALHAADGRPEGFGTFTFAWIDRCRPKDVLALRNMPHVTSQMRSPSAISEADHRQFIEAYEGLDRYDFILIDNPHDRYIGAFYVTNLNAVPEIGKYIGDPSYLGKGIAYTAMQRLLDFCRSKTGLRRLVSTTRPGNARNIALNTKLGFQTAEAARGGYVVMTLEL